MSCLGWPGRSFYAWRNRIETPTAARRRRLAVEVARVFDGSRQTSGCRRIAAALNRDGHECSVGLVADLMREFGLEGGAAARLQAQHDPWGGPGRAPGSDRP